MVLDFAWMDKITETTAAEDFKEEPAEKQASQIAQERVLGDGEYKTTSEDKNAAEGQETALDAKWRLKRKEEALEADKKRLTEAYQRIQDNIKKSEELQASIMKGIKAGEDTTALLFQALDAISRMTGNPLFYTQARGDLIAIYGEAMLEPLPIQWEIDETMQRFEKILAAMSREHDPDAQARIEAAAKAHYAKLERLQALLDEAQAKPKAVPAGSV